MLAVDKSIPTKTIPSPEDIEVISGQLLTQHPVMICLVYNPSNSEGIYQHKLILFLCDVIQSNNEVIILGNATDWSMLPAESSFYVELCEFIFQYNLSQVILSLTHNRGNILDLVIANSNELISDIVIHSKDMIPDQSSSDLQSYFTINRPQSCTQTYPHPRGDYDGMIDFLYNIDLTTY